MKKYRFISIFLITVTAILASSAGTEPMRINPDKAVIELITTGDGSYKNGSGKAQGVSSPGIQRLVNPVLTLRLNNRPVYTTGEDKKDLLRMPSEASCELAVSETGPLQPVIPDWQPHLAPGNLAPPAEDARKVCMILKGWSKLVIPSGREQISVTGDRSLPDQWPADRNYTHAWYVSKVEFNPDVQERIWMRFDAVAHSCVVFVNGKEAGSHLGGFTPFECDISTMVRPGPNTIALWVQDETAVVDKENKRAFSQLGYGRGSHNAHVAGIRGGVYFEDRMPMHVAKIRIRPSTRENNLNVQTWLRGNLSGGIISQVVYKWPDGTDPVLGFPERHVNSAENSGDGMIENNISWNDPELWSPEHPNLYVLRTTLTAGGRSESFDTRFGFREFWIEGKHFMLNGKPIRVLGDTDTRFGLASIVPGKSLDYDREILEFLKREFHFNSIRLHNQIFPHWAMLAADEAGYLVTNQSAIWSAKRDWYDRGSEELLRNTEPQFAEWYWRDVNSPSVVIWDVENEMIRDRRTPELEYWTLQLDHFIRKLDPEAIIEHSGAGWYHPDQEIIHVHMQEQYSRIMSEWAESGTIPMVLGEFWMGGRGETRLPNSYEYSDRQDWHQEEARIYREEMLEMRYHGVSGIMPHRLLRWPVIKPQPLLSLEDPDHGSKAQFHWRFPGIRNLSGRGLAPVVGFIWPRGASVAEGEPFSREVVVCNDREDEASLRVVCSYGNQARQWDITPGPGEQRRFDVSFMPEKDASEMLVAVTGSHGRAIEGDRVDIHIIPRSLATFSGIKRRVVVVSEADQPTASALKELNITFSVSEKLPEDAAGTIVLVPPGAGDDALGRTSLEVSEYLSSGGRLLVLAQDLTPRWLPVRLPFWSAVRSSVPEFDRGGWAPTNKDLIYSRELQVYACGHPAVDGLKAGDFKEWDPRDGRVSDDVFVRPNAVKMRADGEYRVILGATRRENASLVEFKTGQGTGMLCQAQVLKQHEHPAARTLLFNLLRYLDGPAWEAGLARVGLLGELSGSQLAGLTGTDKEMFAAVTKKDDAPSLILAGDHAGVELIHDLASSGSTVLVLSCETCDRLPGYTVEQGEGRYYSGTRSGVEDHPLFWGVSSASFLPLEQTPVKGALSAVPPEARILLGGHCCGHSPLKRDWSLDIGFWGLETREAAPPVAVVQNIGKGSIIATTIEPWNPLAETHRQMLTTLLANVGVEIPDKAFQIQTVEVKRTVPLKFDGLLDDWTNDMEDINLSEYSHADPITLTSKDIIEGQVDGDLDLSALIYLLHDDENLYIGGITFSSTEQPRLTMELSANTVMIDPGNNLLEITGKGSGGGQIITGRQQAGAIIDTRLLNLTKIHRQTGQAELQPGTPGVTFEAAVPWISLGFKGIPDKLEGRFRLSRPDGDVLQRPLPFDEGREHMILQVQKQ